ncbi:hypothetical protein PS2_001583 [Malus domestica]|uniref:Uncharacterized protein n=1 Tax=Malus domestica TaxID=3750 RepID=A0A498KMH6_MALDO|nr:hypothetical protein DVH24_022851 [Malus domestica]
MSFIVGFLKEEFYRKFSGFFRKRSFLEKVSSKSKELASFFKAFLAIILHGCDDMGCVVEVKSVHGSALKSEPSDQNLLDVLNHVARAYSKCSDFGTGRRDEMPQRKIFDGDRERFVPLWV